MRRKTKLSIAAVLTLCFSILLSTMPASSSPSIESCDSAGNTKDNFSPGESVYLKGSGLKPSSTYDCYIYDDYEAWIMGTTTHEVLTGGGYTQYRAKVIWTDSNGYIKDQPELIYSSGQPGQDDLSPGAGYDIWLDSRADGTVGTYDVCDRLDNLDVDTAGFFVIPGTQLGTIAVLLAGFAGLLLKKRNG